MAVKDKKENPLRQNTHTLSLEEKGEGISKEVSNSSKKVYKKATFLLPAELHKRLKTAAVEQDMTMLEIVEKALENYLRK